MFIQKRFNRILLLDLILVFMVLLSAGLAFGAEPHDFSDFGCEGCHNTNNVDAEVMGDELNENIDAWCVKCHDSCSHGKKHGGAQISGSFKSTALPLRQSGKVACFTCHDPHMSFMDRKSQMRTSYLRISNLKRELCLNCHRVGGKDTGSFKVIYPPQKVIVHNGYVPLIGRAEELSGKRLKVTLNGASFSLRVQDDIFYARLKIDEGLNYIELSIMDVTLWKGEIYSLEAEGDTVNYDMVYYSHQTDSPADCLGCHKNREGMMSIAAANSPELCQRCHQPKNTKKFVHGPLGAGECLPCHDPHGGSGPFYLKAEGSKLCLMCHLPEEIDRHADTVTISKNTPCLECHDPHQSDTWYLGKGSKMTMK